MSRHYRNNQDWTINISGQDSAQDAKIGASVNNGNIQRGRVSDGRAQLFNLRHDTGAHNDAHTKHNHARQPQTQQNVAQVRLECSHQSDGKRKIYQKRHKLKHKHQRGLGLVRCFLALCGSRQRISNKVHRHKQEHDDIHQGQNGDRTHDWITTHFFLLQLSRHRYRHCECGSIVLDHTRLHQRHFQTVAKVAFKAWIVIQFRLEESALQRIVILKICRHVVHGLQQLSTATHAVEFQAGERKIETELFAVACSGNRIEKSFCTRLADQLFLDAVRRVHQKRDLKHDASKPIVSAAFYSCESSTSVHYRRGKVHGQCEAG
mmetsp:Transcript_42369/g.69863  ORF Transcript_42369/g.69863 Transcript_42369/m.69863 type:complete len:320 (-) Transcript_42369:228-1187(-)